MILTDGDHAIKFIKENLTPKPWVLEARTRRIVLDALVTGKDFKTQITIIEGLESDVRKIAREKYSKDIRDLQIRINLPRDNVFVAPGGDVHIEISSEEQTEKLIATLKEFKGQKSIRKYLSEELFKLGDIDPNGLIFTEYKEDIDIYPTYKSIKDIRFYESDGQLCDVLLFEPKTIRVNNQTIVEWRLVDEQKDWRVWQIGNVYTVNEELTFEHPFGKVPAIIISERKELGSELRLSNIHSIEERLKDYARDKSILTIYKFQNGFPINWRFEQTCKTCNGTGKNGTKVCKPCGGTGDTVKNDVTDIRVVKVPREGDPVIAPNIGGFISPDLETWKQYKEDLKTAEEEIESTLWGTAKVADGKNETATGRWLDVQPVMNRLSVYTNYTEWVENQLICFVENWVNGSAKEEGQFTVTYGDRYILESQDVLLDKYNEARDSGSNNTILDKLLSEYLLAKNQNNAKNLDIEIKKMQVEPYLHLSPMDTNAFYGPEESYKKVLFVDFWEEADTSQEVETLKVGFQAYATTNKLIITKPKIDEPS